MSRCFPFPPPGYEKKARTDEVDLLKKEKHTEKKHKKEKRDKEKRESKEKRDKEGRDGKHKETKDKKEKHREKKKDKDKGNDRDKSKNITADEKGFPGQAEGPTAGKLHQKEIKQIDKKGILFEEKLTRQYTGKNNGQKARENNHLAEESKDSKFLLELDRRIKDNDGGAGNQLVQKFSNANHRKDEGTVRLVGKGSGTWPDSKEKIKDKDIGAKNIDGKRNHAEVQPVGNATNQNHAENFHPRVGGMPRVVENNFDRNLEATIEGKEKVKDKKDEGKEKVKEKKYEAKNKVKERKDDKRGDKRKDKDKEKKGHGKEKERDKEKKKEEKAKERNELKNTEMNKIKEGNKAGPMGEVNSFPQLSRNSHENSISGENLKKRKDTESNGVPHANDNWPSKLPRPSPCHPFTENGRILDTCQISIPNASDRPGGVATTVKLDNKEQKINGIIIAHPFAVSSTKTHPANVPTDPPVPEASAKPPPPHPDTKYLSRVYSVPKIEEWSGVDDQEWLFGSNSSQERKPVVESSEAGETLQVWAEALHLEAADVFALPYVIPY